MEPFSQNVDIFLSFDGDIEFENGDIKTISGVDWLKRKVFKLMITEPGDWKLYGDLGAKPTQFIGEPNTRSTGTLLQQYITEKIGSYILPATVDVRVVPISREAVKAYIDLLLGDFLLGTIPFSIDFINGLVYPDFDDLADTVTSSKNTRFNSSNSVENNNPVWNRIRNQ